jgi:hypothetical protein
MTYLPKYKRILFIALLAALVAGCREEYDPDIDVSQKVLVVEGMVTSLNEQTSVTLSMAEPYNSDLKASAVTGAFVYIRDDKGKIDVLNANFNGHYVTDTSFRGVTGSTYTLHIQTSDGSVYRSTPQLLLPAAGIDSIYGELSQQEFIYTDIWGNTTGKLEDGAQTFADFHSNAGDSVHYRIGTRMLIGYSYTDPDTKPFATIYYLWKKLEKDRTLNITGINNSISAEVMNRYSAHFFPLNPFLYGMTSDQNLENFFLQIKLYTLNDEAFAYYRDVSSQLSATGKLFDPIATQVYGNIICTSDASKLVLGFFEASGCVKQTYWVQPLSGDNRVDYGLTYDLDGIPDSGKTTQTRPYFWHF